MTMTTTTLTRAELTTKEAAEYLGVSRVHIRWLIHVGHLPAHRRGGGNYLWRDDLDAYAADPRNRTPGRKPYPREPYRYGRAYQHIPRTVRVAPRDVLADDVAALIVAHTDGQRDLAATVRAVIKRVRAEPQKG